MGLLDRLRGKPPRSLATARRDSTGGRWVNGAGMGGPTDQAQMTEWSPGEPVGQHLADELLRFNGIMRTVAGREAQDCTRAGYDLTEMDPGLADELEQVVEGGKKGPGLGARSMVAEGRMWARAYGGGGVVVLVDDGRPFSQPIDRANIRRVNGLLSFNRYEMPIVRWGADHKEHRTFGKPQIYRLNLNRGGGMGQQVDVHADRVIRIRGLELPRHLQQRQQGWDGSVFDLVYGPLRDYQASLAMLPEAIRMLSQGVLTSPALSDALEVDGAAEVFHARLAQFRATQGLYNVASLGAEETYAEHARSMAGIKDAFEALSDGLVAANNGMPRLVLLGKPTTGLGSTDKGEMQVWYDSCAAKQPVIYTPAIREIVDLVMLSHEGPTRGQMVDYSVEWRSLYQASEATQATTDLTRAQRRAVDVGAMVVTPAQVQTGDPSVMELYGELEGPPAPSESPGAEPDDGPLGEVEDDAIEPEGVVQLAPAALPSQEPLPVDLVTQQEAAAAARVTPRRIGMMMRSGELSFWNFGGSKRLSLAEVTRAGQQHRAPAAAE